MRCPCRLCFVFAQKDRRKYSWSLPRLLEVSNRFEEWEPHVVVVDNDREGDWEHSVSERLTHVGGDNTHWEFSAFDRGIGWARERLDEPELWVLATDACLAYGEEYLELVTPAVAQLAVGEAACVGWIDSFGETCSILGLEYEAWLRTSFLFVPDPVVRRFEPLALDLPTEEIFRAEPDRPFRSTAPIGTNCQTLVRTWLTKGVETAGRLEETWHSGFELTVETLPFFQAKVSAILREHLLSATLRAAGVPAYDFRVVRSLTGAESEDREGWSWLRGLQRQRAERVGSPGSSPSGLVMAADFTNEGNRRVAVFLAREVLPLLRQRHGGASLTLIGPGGSGLIEVAGRPGVRLAGEPRRLDSWLETSAALIAAPEPDPGSERAERLAVDLGVPVVREGGGEAPLAATLLAGRLEACLAGTPRRAG